MPVPERLKSWGKRGNSTDRGRTGFFYFQVAGWRRLLQFLAPLHPPARCEQERTWLWSGRSKLHNSVRSNTNDVCVNVCKHPLDFPRWRVNAIELGRKRLGCPGKLGSGRSERIHTGMNGRKRYCHERCSPGVLLHVRASQAVVFVFGPAVRLFYGEVLSETYDDGDSILSRAARYDKAPRENKRSRNSAGV